MCRDLIIGATGRECLGVAVARDLVISASPTSDNLTPQETTTQDAHETGRGWFVLSW